MADENDEELRAGIEELGEHLALEFSALEAALRRVRESSDVARAIPEGQILNVLSNLRLAASMDELSATFLELRDAEHDAADSLLDAAAAGDLEDDYDDDFEDEDEDLDTDDFGALLT